MAKKKFSLEPLAQFGQTAPTTPGSAGQAATPFAPVQVRPAQSSPTPASSGSAASLLQLLWLDHAVAGRLRRNPAWRAIIDRVGDSDDLDLSESLKQSASDDSNAARVTFEVLAQAPATEVDSLRVVLGEAVRADGKMAPPLVVVAGELVLDPDVDRQLLATADIVEPLAASNADLQSTWTGMQPYLAQPRTVVGGAAKLCDQLMTAVRSALPSAPHDHFEAVVQRLLVEERAYAQCDVFGEPHTRARLRDAPVYLPTSASQHLPLSMRIGCRLLVEVNPRIDEAETHPVALRARALCREVERGSW